ncbi:MAG TPA: nuclear transport factor 2 family protein [Sphingomicrobium sp.]|nr:nuclear transport factor 2 family protein [Sphingomicrobium sp.]
MSFVALRAAAFGALIALAPPLSAREPAAVSTAASALSQSARGAAAVVDAFHAALRKGDTRSAAAMLAGNALIFEGGGVERSKAEYASHHLVADAEYTKAVPAVLTRRAGDAIGTVAWIASEGRTTGTFRGKAVDRVTAETMILRRIGHDWKIVHIHWSSAARP